MKKIKQLDDLVDSIKNNKELVKTISELKGVTQKLKEDTQALTDLENKEYFKGKPNKIVELQNNVDYLIREQSKLNQKLKDMFSQYTYNNDYFINAKIALKNEVYNTPQTKKIDDLVSQEVQALIKAKEDANKQVDEALSQIQDILPDFVCDQIIFRLKQVIPSNWQAKRDQLIEEINKAFDPNSQTF